MSWTNELGPWLAHSAVSGTLILLMGALAVRLCGQPVYRIRIIQWTFAACLLVPLVQQLGIQPAYTLNWLSLPSANELAATGGLPLPEGNARRGEALARINSANGDESVTSKMITAERPVQAANELSRAASFVDDAAVDHAAGDEVGLSTVTVLGRTMKIVYLSLVAMLGGWWCLGFMRRRAITRNAWPASEAIRRVLISIAGEQANRVRLLVSPSVQSPVMWGCWQPTIVIPAEHAKSPSCAPLRWGLAHEWSHVARRDFRAHVLAGLVKFVCFYQPCYWWLRRELSLSQDFLADAFAAKHGEATEAYASFLVSMARERQAALSPVSLGMSDGRSTLFQRIRVLLQAPRPLLQSGRRLPVAMIATVSVAMMLCFGSVRFGANAADVESANEAEKEQADKNSDKEDARTNEKEQQLEVAPITYTGRVIDRESGEPIAGATVEVKHELSHDPKTGEWILLETTSHTSDESGQYSFTLPSEQVAEPSLYLEVNAFHPDYQSKGGSGYSHTMIRTNLEKGDPPFYATIKLSPGEPITGIVKRPDGTPAPGVQISTYSAGPAKDGDTEILRGAFQYTETDDDGRFRIVVATPGDGVLWIHPSDFAPQAHRIGDKRGDMGTIALEKGITVRGQVLDAKGNPVPHVAVNARRRGDGEEIDGFLGTNAVANGIRGGTTTDVDGRFQLKPLPPGTYRTQIEASVSDPTVPSGDWFARPKVDVNDVFAPLQLTIAADAEPQPVVIQALPHVVIHGRFFNSKGEPRASHGQHFFGKFNGDFVFKESTRPGDDGWFEIRVPHGTTEGRINTMTNEHSALRWRLEGMEEFTYGDFIPLGTLEADVNGLEIIRYSAPILLVKAVDESGDVVEGFRVSSEYVKPPQDVGEVTGERRIYNDGAVRFEEQADGRWRSSQLLPDAEITIKAVKDGFECEPQSVSLREKETRELTFVLKKAATSTDTDESGDGATTGVIQIEPVQK